MAQVVIGVRRSGKSTICHKVLLERGIRYGYVNLDNDRLADMKTEDLNTILSCVYQLYGTDIPYLVLDEIQDVDGWYLFVNRLLRTDLHIFVTGAMPSCSAVNWPRILQDATTKFICIHSRSRSIAYIIMLTLRALPPRLMPTVNAPLWITSTKDDTYHLGIGMVAKSIT